MDVELSLPNRVNWFLIKFTPKSIGKGRVRVVVLWFYFEFFGVFSSFSFFLVLHGNMTQLWLDLTWPFLAVCVPGRAVPAVFFGGGLAVRRRHPIKRFFFFGVDKTKETRLPEVLPVVRQKEKGKTVDPVVVHGPPQPPPASQTTQKLPSWAQFFGSWTVTPPKKGERYSSPEAFGGGGAVTEFRFFTEFFSVT